VVEIVSPSPPPIDFLLSSPPPKKKFAKKIFANFFGGGDDQMPPPHYFAPSRHLKNTHHMFYLGFTIFVRVKIELKLVVGGKNPSPPPVDFFVTVSTTKTVDA